MRGRRRHRSAREAEGGGRRIYDPRRWHTPTRGSSTTNTGKGGEAPAGWVLVWAGRFKRWRRRWFVAHPAGLLLYYKSSDQVGRPGCINLLGARIVPDGAKARQLKIIRGPIVYYLRTTNKEFRQGWLDAICESVRIYHKSLANAGAGLLPSTSDTCKNSREECEQQEKELSRRLEERLHDIEPACQELLDKLHGLQESLIVISEALGFSSATPAVVSEQTEHRNPAHRSLFGRRAMKREKEGSMECEEPKALACKRSFSCPVEDSDVSAADGPKNDRLPLSKKRLSGDSTQRACAGEKKKLPVTLQQKSNQGLLHAAWINLRRTYEEALKEEIGRVIELEAENLVLQESLAMLPQLRKDRLALIELREKLKEEKRPDEPVREEDSEDEISIVGTEMTNEEYFEALEVLNQHDFIAKSMTAEEQEICADVTQEPPEEGELDVSEAEVEDMELPRTRLPAPRPLSMGFSLWTVLKNAIGKDLNHITMPATINEPLSALQRCAEQMQYRYLLQLAAEQTSSMERLLLVSSFACAAYNGTILRDAKPFNPMLGETYEWQASDGSARFISEQVSHHPPVMAFQAEATKGDYTMYGEIEIKNRFWGKSVEVHPVGTILVRFPKFDDHFTWSQVTTCIHNVVVGKPWIDSYGEMTIKNHKTNEYARIRFHKASSREQGGLSGKAYDSQGDALFNLHGNFMDKLLVSSEPSSGEDGTVKCLWRSPPPPQDHRQQYFFSQFAIGLNELTSKLARALPPTDSRFRPDQRALEDGELDKATPEKFRLEEKQRRSRKLAKEQGIERKSMWFHQSNPGKAQVQVDDDMEPNWRYNGLYWEHREKQAWDQCPDIM